MMLRWGLKLLLIVGVAELLSCDVVEPSMPELPIETSFSFINFSTTMYAQLELRSSDGSPDDGDFFKTPLLAPGVTYRRRFLETLAEACPKRLDLRVLLYARINEDVPIGLDAGEAVGTTPVVAGEVIGVPACTGTVVETYTVVNWDTPNGTARIKIAQATPVEQLIRSLGLFPNPDAVWEIAGVSPNLSNTPPQSLAQMGVIIGRVTTVGGVGVDNIGVLIRSRFRVRLGDDDLANDPDAGFGDPIDFVVTDVDGTFRFDRPAGAYRVEAFSDEFAFRPASVDVESPVDTLWFVAELIKP